MTENLILFALTLVSCFLVGIVKMKSTFSILKTSYQQQFKVLLDQSMDDQTKQHALLQSVQVQMKQLAILTIKLIITVSPFLLFYLFSPDYLNHIISFNGMVISLIAILTFITIRFFYAKLLKSR